MDTQKVEKYAGVVSKIATGLKVWNIIGIFANLFVLIGVASTFVPSVQEELAKQGVEHNFETAGVGVAIFLLFFLLCTFATILYHKIGKSAKTQALPDKNLFFYIIGIHVFSILMQIANNIFNHQKFSVTTFVIPAIIAGLLAWLYMTYQKWAQEVAKR